jgi:Holliday junction resolvase
MNTSRKGRAREHQSRRRLEQQGYSVMLAAASKGTFDLVAVGPDDVQFVQVKA